MAQPTRNSVAVQIPSHASDRPSWVKVGVIAVVGFAVGVAWPRLAGIRPGPSAPAEAAVAVAPGMRANDPAPPSVAAPAVTVPSAPAAPSPAAAPATANATASAPAVASNVPAVLVTRGNVVSCKTQDGEMLKGAACGNVAMFDALAQPRLKRLAHCPTAAGASGKLAVVFSLDFARNRLNFSFGKSSTMENKDSLDQCLRASLDKVSINAVDHDNPLYAVFYMVTFTPRDSASTPIPVTNVAASGVTATPSAVATPLPNAPSAASDSAAQVAWEVAIVRDSPRTGNVIARLQRGTKVHVGAGSTEGWYKVQYGASFGSEGWVYRGAIGK